MPQPSRISPIRHALKPLLLLLVIFYIGFHALSGERGLYAWVRESKRLEHLKQELAAAKAEREKLEKNVKLLSSASLDLDMLDERARIVLGYAGGNDTVVGAKDFSPR